MPQPDEASKDATDMHDDEPELTNNLSATDDGTMESLTDNTQQELGVINLAFEENEDGKRKSSFDAQKNLEQEKNAANGKILNHSQQQIHIPEDAVINYDTARLRKPQQRGDDAKVKEVVALDVFSDCAKAQEAMLCDALVANGGATVPVSSPLASSELGNGTKMFEEYFIPVNTHKKFLRGEKLYLTKEKRKVCSGWKKIMLCCLLLITLGIAVLVGVLAATGFLLRDSKSPPKSVHVDPSSPTVSASTSKLKGAPPPKDQTVWPPVVPPVLAKDITTTTIGVATDELTTTEQPTTSTASTEVPATASVLSSNGSATVMSVTTAPVTSFPPASTTEGPATKPETTTETPTVPTVETVTFASTEATTVTEEMWPVTADLSEPEFRSGFDASPYVPNEVLGEFVLPEGVFTDQLSNMSSTESQSLTAGLTSALKKALLDKGYTFENVKILGYRQGSIVASFIIVSGDKHTPAKDVTEAIRRFLAQNDGKLGSHAVDASTLKAEDVTNECRIENGHCPFMCKWDYVTMESMCTCPEGYKSMDGACVVGETTPTATTGTGSQTVTIVDSAAVTTSSPTTYESTTTKETSSSTTTTIPVTETYSDLLQGPETEETSTTTTAVPATTNAVTETEVSKAEPTTTAAPATDVATETTVQPSSAAAVHDEDLYGSQEQPTTVPVTTTGRSAVGSTVRTMSEEGTTTTSATTSTAVPPITTTADLFTHSVNANRARRVDEDNMMVTMQLPSTSPSMNVSFLGIENDTTTEEPRVFAATEEDSAVTETPQGNKERSVTDSPEMATTTESVTTTSVSETPTRGEDTTEPIVAKDVTTTSIEERNSEGHPYPLQPLDTLPDVASTTETQNETSTVAPDVTEPSEKDDITSTPTDMVTEMPPVTEPLSRVDSSSENDTDTEDTEGTTDIPDNNSTDLLVTGMYMGILINATDSDGMENSTDVQSTTLPPVTEDMMTAMTTDLNVTVETTTEPDGPNSTEPYISDVEDVDKELNGTNRTYAMGRNLTFMNNDTIFEDGMDMVNGSVDAWNMTANSTSYSMANFTFLEAREAVGAGGMNASNYTADGMLDAENVTTTESTDMAAAMCLAEEYTCPGSDKCIGRGLLCDQFVDCPDAKDEENCTASCEDNFKCNDGSCIIASAKCDGIWDCPNGEDEQLCKIVDTTCMDLEVMCLDNSACIKPLSICDGIYNCRDRSDENGCVERTTCESSNRFYCGDGLCIPSSLRCDGHSDCKDGEDEMNCTCSENQFQCMNGYCVSKPPGSAKNLQCDGTPDCNDTSDEIGCVKVDTNGIVHVFEKNLGNWVLMCGDNFSASDGDTICREMGYSKALSMSSLVVETNLTTWTKWDASAYKDYWSQGIMTSDTCNEGALVLRCQQFECANQTEVLFRIEREVSTQGHHSDVWPYLALIYGVDADTACHAEIVSPLWLLTSAACLDQLPNNASWLYVQANFDGDGMFVEQKNVERVVKHPHASQFRSNALPDYDLALVQLTEPLEFSSHLTAVCLPEDVVRPGVTCFVGSFGDGRPRVPFEKSSSIIHLPLVINELSTCNSDQHYKTSVSHQMICADGGNMKRQLCDSDLGSPLMCLSSNNIWRLAGILSYQRFCGTYHKHPAVFANIYGMRDFIDTFTGLKFYNTIHQPPLYTIPVVPMMRDDLPTEVPFYGGELTTPEPNATDVSEALVLNGNGLEESYNISANATDIFDYEDDAFNTTGEAVGSNATEASTTMMPSVTTAIPTTTGNPQNLDPSDIIEGLGQYPYPLIASPHYEKYRGIGSPRRLDVEPHANTTTVEGMSKPLEDTIEDVTYLADEGMSRFKEQNYAEDITTVPSVTPPDQGRDTTTATVTPELNEENPHDGGDTTSEDAVTATNMSTETLTEGLLLTTETLSSEDPTTVKESVSTTDKPLGLVTLPSEGAKVEASEVEASTGDTTMVTDYGTPASPFADICDVRLDNRKAMARYEGRWLPICGRNWNDGLSDLFCQHLGYGKATETQLIAIEMPHIISLVHIMDENETFINLLSSLIPSNDTCDTSVSITCGEYECGTWNLAHGDEPGPNARIVSTTGATEGQWPSVGLLKSEDKVCITSILSPNWLLTSWSCMSKSSYAENISAWYFVQDAPLLTRADTVVSRNYTLSHVFRHPELKILDDITINDVALVRTARPVDVVGAARAVCLSNGTVQPQQLCVTAGWGISESESVQHLHYLPVPLTSVKDCNGSQNYDGKLHNAMTCASFVDKERALCQKDSGAPLMCISEHNRWELQGVLTLQRDCNNVQRPSIFTSIYHVSRWIKGVLGSSYH